MRYILIALLAVASCGNIENQTPAPKPKIQVVCINGAGSWGDYPNYYVIEIDDKIRWIYEYLPTTNITNWYALYNKDKAIKLAKYFDSYEKIDRWNDSVKSLVKPQPDRIIECGDRVKVY